MYSTCTLPVPIHVIGTSMHRCVGTLCQGGKVPIPRAISQNNIGRCGGAAFPLGKGIQTYSVKFPHKKKQKRLLPFVPTSQGPVAGTCAHMGTTALLLVTVHSFSREKETLFSGERGGGGGGGAHVAIVIEPARVVGGSSHGRPTR